MRTIIVIPTYDERDNVMDVLDAVRRESPDVDVLVVDDSSPDGTADLVRAHRDHGHRIHLLQRREKDGLGAAYRAGFRWALEHDYEAILQMDADLSHPPDRVQALRAALDEADVAIGSRYVVGGGVRDWPMSRRVISWCGNAYVRLVLGLPVRDATAGFKAFRRDALIGVAATDSVSDGYCFQIETTWQAARRGLRVVEVPIIFTDRTHGASKMSPDIVREAVGRVLIWRWEELRHPRAAEAVTAGLRAGGHDVAV